MARASLDDLCEFVRRKYRLSPASMDAMRRTLARYYERKKGFDLIVDNGRVMVLAEKTPSPPVAAAAGPTPPL